MNARVAKGLLQELEEVKDKPDGFFLVANIGGVVNICWPDWAERWKTHKTKETRLDYVPLRKGEHRVQTLDATMQDYYDDLYKFLYDKAFQ